MPVAQTAPDLIAGKAVRSLVEAQAIRAATILGQPGVGSDNYDVRLSDNYDGR